MKKISLGVAAIALLFTVAGTATAQCVGDCNDDGSVAVNELVLGVNIALAAAEISACPVFDANEDGTVAVNELITGVNNALSGCPTGGDDCGNNIVEGDEECDDGNTDGGDGCASNCTNETRVACTLGGNTSATVQTTLFAIPLSLTGSQAYTFGSARGSGDVAPVVVKAADLSLDPVMVPGLVCACVRGAEGEGFGPGNTASGSVGCGEGGLDEVNYLTVQDHNINDEDPNCETGELEDGSEATPHVGVCNGPRTHTFAGGGPRGSMYLDFVDSISLIADGGLCEPQPGNPDMGPDGIPCTDDDPDQADPAPLPLTTGTASGKVLDANNTLLRNIAGDARCGALDCLVEATGSPINCDLLDSDPAGALAGSSLVGALSAIDAATIGDNVVTSIFQCE